jgi:hypothetical protein
MVSVAANCMATLDTAQFVAGVIVGDDEHAAGPGTVAVLPKGLRHAYVVTSATARFLTLHNPGGFEQFAAEVGEPAQALTLPPQTRRTLPH